MHHHFLIPVFMAAGLALTGCSDKGNATVERAFQDVNVVDESDLNDVMLTVSDPNEAVDYFRRSLQQHPDRVDLQRGLALSLIRAKRTPEGVAAWSRVVGTNGATADDRIELADAQIRNGDWAGAEQTLDDIAPTYETFKRYRLEAMVADANEEWEKSDSFYETAVGLTTTPAGVMNNWGYSKLTRGDYAGAERMFGQAIRQEPSMFTAKNNLILARGAQRNYALPVVPMTQIERAELLHTLALTAIKQGDVKTGEGLLREAIDTHPQHFDEATRSLRALESS